MSLLLSGCLVWSGEWGVGSGESGIGTSSPLQKRCSAEDFS